MVDFVLGPLTAFQDGGRYLYVNTDVFAGYTSEGVNYIVIRINTQIDVVWTSYLSEIDKKF